MNILFICKFNRFRSKVAEALFNKLNKKHKAKSAGIIRGTRVTKEILDASKDFNLKLNTKTKGLTTEMLKWHDLAIIVADDVPKDILKDNKKYGKLLKIWKIKDTDSYEKEEIKKIIYQIEDKIKSLTNNINNLR